MHAVLDEIQMSFVDSALSPWAEDGYLGRLLTAEEARESDVRAATLQVAEIVSQTIPEVIDFLAR